MNTTDVALPDPFDPSAPDEEAELSALARALEMAEGFRLIFVRCNQLPQRQRLIEEVQSRLTNFKIQTISFRQPMEHLLDEIKSRLSTPLPNALFISGLEFSLPVAAEAHSAPLIANLNAARNSFAQLLSCPLVLWVPEYVLTAIAQGAPDFFSIRSGVYFFAAKPDEIIHIGKNLSTRELWSIESLSHDEKQDRISAIERLLADYEFLPTTQRNQYTEIRLREQLATLFHTLGEFEKSLANSERALKIAEVMGDLRGVARCHQSMAMVQQDRGNYDLALDHYHRAFKLYEDLNDTFGKAGSLQGISSIYAFRGNNKESLVYYQRTLALYEELGSMADIAVTLHNIGNVYLTIGDYEAALSYCLRAFKINEEKGIKSGVSDSLHLLGYLQYLQGDYESALTSLMRSFTIREELGDKLGSALTQGLLGHILTKKDQFTKAFSFILNAFGLLIQLQSPQANSAATDLKILRSKWGGFDEAWRKATNSELPEWLLQNNEPT